MLGLRYAFVTREAGTPGGLEASLLSARHLAPVRQLPGGRWDIRIVPLALVLTVALREEPAGLELQLDLYEASPVVLRWSDGTLAAVAADKAFQFLMTTCVFASSVPGRPGLRRKSADLRRAGGQDVLVLHLIRDTAQPRPLE